ncbi:MAG: hypothetical protein LKE36_02005 [Bacilli bacterium]|nr:hypothetical protein [Bacilli bacterium]MCH4201708.1 hypothetical protein [Bacilli bacterium]
MKKSSNGNIFARIWNWIKNTAWIQPLLIVGIIFGIIFSIPSITSAIKDAKEKNDSAETFYARYQVTLEGKENSAAQKLINDIADEQLDGQKFFLVFVSSDCSACEEAKDGFAELKNYTTSELGGNKFALKTIFTDEETDDQDELSTTPFLNFLTSDDTTSFMNTTVDWVQQNSIYYSKHMLGKSSFADADSILDSISNGYEESSSFQTPTVFLVDFSQEAIDAGNQGVKEAFVGVPGSDKYEKAEFLAECWNTTGDFAK